MRRMYVRFAALALALMLLTTGTQVFAYNVSDQTSGWVVDGSNACGTIEMCPSYAVATTEYDVVGYLEVSVRFQYSMYGMDWFIKTNENFYSNAAHRVTASVGPYAEDSNYFFMARFGYGTHRVNGNERRTSVMSPHLI